MTQLINMSIPTTKISKKPSYQKLQKTRSSIYSSSSLQMGQNQYGEKEFQQIIRQQSLPYDMLFVAFEDEFAVRVSVLLVEKDGRVVKILDQERKTFLLQKYSAHKKLYQPLIDPLTGVVAFRFGYFQYLSIPDNQQSWCIKKEKIIKNLKMDKLYQQIKKFYRLLNHGQQFNFNENFKETTKYYLPLTKIISQIYCSNFRPFHPFTSKTNIDQPNQTIYGHDNKTQFYKKYQQNRFLQQLDHHLSSTKQPSTNFNLKQVQKQLKKIQSSSQNLSQLTKRKSERSNYDSLLVNTKTQKSINDQLSLMKEKNIPNSNMKIVQGLLGRVTINFDKQQESKYLIKKKLLMMLSKNTQYHFLDNYFSNELNVPISMSLSLKEQSLPAYFEANSIVMSLETKMRIFVQICSGVQTLWEEKNIILFIHNLNQIFITKNLTVKIRSLYNYLKVETHMLLQEKALMNSRLIDNLLNLTEICFKLFFRHNISFSKPSNSMNSEMKKKSDNSYRGIDLLRKNIGTKLTRCNQSLPSPMREILSGLSYIFWQYVNKAQQMNIKQKYKLNMRQILMHQQSQSTPLNNSSNNNKKQQQQENLLNFKPICCWLLKNLQIIVQQKF